MNDELISKAIDAYENEPGVMQFPAMKAAAKVFENHFIADIEALRKDAERYRWIRQNVVRYGNNGVQFDSEIDAAMKEQAE